MLFKTYYRTEFGRTVVRTETAVQAELEFGRDTSPIGARVIVARLPIASARYVPGVLDNA